MAQWIARWTPNSSVVGSNPISGKKEGHLKAIYSLTDEKMIYLNITTKFNIISVI